MEPVIEPSNFSDIENITNLTVPFTETTTSSSLMHSLIYTVVMITINSIIFLLGVLGNGLVIAVFFKHYEMKTVTNMFIFNLAVADEFVLLICLPTTLIANVYNAWILGSFLCRILPYTQAVTVVASVYSMVAISLDRLIMANQSNMCTHGFTRIQATCGIVVIWLLAFLIPLPWAMVFELQILPEEGLLYCEENWTSNDHGIYFFFFLLFFCFICPLTIISRANANIMKKVLANCKFVESRQNMEPRRCPAATNGVGKMLGLIVLIFCICWLPLYGTVALIKLRPGAASWEIWFYEGILPLLQSLSYCNSFANPGLYALYNKRFRNHCYPMFPKCIGTVLRRWDEKLFGKPRQIEGKNLGGIVGKRQKMQSNELGTEVSFVNVSPGMVLHSEDCKSCDETTV